MRFLLDTNVVSELRKSAGSIDPHVDAWSESVDAEAMAISALTVLELEQGVRRAERRDPGFGSLLRLWLDRVLAAFDRRVLPVDHVIARTAARLSDPDPMPVVDGLIAATGLVHGLTVVTRNVSDFRRSDVTLLNPFDPRN